MCYRIGMTEFPPSHHYPEGADPDRAPTDPASLRTTNEEFLDELGHKMDEPYTREELAAQHASAVEDQEIISRLKQEQKVDTSEAPKTGDTKLTKEARNRRWAELDSATHKLFAQVRALFAQIGKGVRSKHDDDQLRCLADQTHVAYQELAAAHEMYLSGTGTTKAFSDMVRLTRDQLRDIERRLSAHP